MSAVKRTQMIIAAVAGLALAAPAAAQDNVYSCIGERTIFPLDQTGCASCAKTDDTQFTLEIDWGDAEISASMTIDEMRLVCDPALVPKGKLVCADHFFGIDFEMDLQSLAFQSGSVDVYSYTASRIIGACKPG